MCELRIVLGSLQIKSRQSTYLDVWAMKHKIKEGTIYGWRARAKKQKMVFDSNGRQMSEEEIKAKNERLRKELKRAREDIEILQDALGFFAKSRRQ